MWARRERIVLTVVAVGDVHVSMTDMAITTDAPKSDDELRKGIYEQFAGPALAELQAEAERSTTTTYDDDDDVPALTDTTPRRKR